MRIPSGKTDIAIYFVAVDATDYVTREAGLATWTVQRSRNGAAEVAYTTPTITEIDATNMPGVYSLLVDEDTTIASTSDSEEYCVHITHAGMAPITRTIELYRRDTTSGQTLTVTTGRANADITHIATAAVSTTTAQLGVNAVQVSGSGTAADNAEVVFATDFATNYDTTKDMWNVDVESWNGTDVTGDGDWSDLANDVSGILVDTGTTGVVIDSGPTTAGRIAAAVWDEDATGHQTTGTFGQAIGDPVADTNTIYGAVVTGAAGATVAADIIAIKAETAAIVDDTGTSGVVLANDAITAAKIAANAITSSELADGAITAAKFAAGAITATVIATGAVDADALAADAVAEIADGVWDEDATGHQTQGTFGQAIGDPAADTNTIFKAVVTDAAGANVAADIIAVKAETAAILDDTDDIGVAGAGLTAINLPDQTMNITGDITGNLSGSVGSVTGAVGSVTGAVGSVTGNVGGTINGLTAVALKDFFDTDSTTTFASAVAGSVVKEIADNAGGSSLTEAGIADAVWDELIAGHLGVGSTGEALSNAGAAGTPPTAAEVADAVWDEAQADHVGAGSFGETATEIAAILVDTVEIGAAGAGLTNINLPNQTMDIVGNITGNLSGSVGSVTGLTASNLDATVSSRASQASVDDIPTNAELATALGTADDAVLTAIGDLPTNAELATALGTADDATLAAIAALSIPTANQNADALLDRADGVETGLTLRNSLRLAAAVLAGKVSGAGSGSETFRNAVADSKNRVVSTVDVDGNRTAITTDLS